MTMKKDTPPAPRKNKVFVVHGHDKRTRNAVVRFIEELHLTPIVLQEKADKGRTVIEKFERHADEVGYAIVLLTPDDRGGVKTVKSLDDLELRARQNVIFELGFFYGKLSRNQVCALLKDKIEIPSDIGGVLWIRMDNSGIWKHRLRMELLEAGLVEPTDDELLEGIDLDALQQSAAVEAISEMLSKPEMSFNLLAEFSSLPCPEIPLNGRGGDHPFGFVLANTSKAVAVVTDIIIRVVVGWNGTYPAQAIEIIRKAGIGTRFDDGWTISIPKLTSEQHAELEYNGSGKSLIVGHPEKWTGFHVRINDDRLQGELNLNYTVTCLKPKFYQKKGILKLIMA